MSTNKLFESITIGAVAARNRVFMAPMTRGRANAEGTPSAAMIEYYRQRASAGLITTEATAISAQGVGWVNAPGIFTDDHVAAWKKVTTAVHEAGGAIFLQLWHMGRVSHPDFQGGELPVGPSAIAAEGESHTPNGKKPYVTPRALLAAELPDLVQDYANAATRAVEAGFDGVEIHGANGYLLDQFIRDGANQRDDEFGGSIENRWRFPLQVVEAVIAAVGPERTSIRLSPSGSYNGMSDTNAVSTFSYGAEQLAKLGLAHVHVTEDGAGAPEADTASMVHPHIRNALGTTPFLLNGGFSQATAESALARGQADAITFGTPFLANPDLVRRYEEGITEFNAPDFSTFFTNEAAGYTDYPALG